MKNPLLLLIPLSFSALQGETLITDFNDNTAGPLGAFNAGEGQAGGIGWLNGDVWANSGTIDVIADDLAAPIATNYAVTQNGTAQSAQGDFAGGRQTTREVETPLSGTIWISYLLNQPSLASRGGITFNQNSAGPANPRIVATGTEVRLGLGPTLQAAGAGADLLTLGETALILARLTIDNAGGAETLDVWINPDVSGEASSLPAPDTTLSEETPALDPGITRVGIQSYSTDNLGGIIDSLRLSDDDNAFEVVTRDTLIVVDDPNLSISTANPLSGTTLTTEDDPITVDIALENTGASNNLTIDNTTAITGDDASSYSMLTTLPLDIPPGGSSMLQIQLDPTGSARLSSASLALSTNDVSTPTFTIPLEARILEPGGNQLLNGNFESDPTSPINWNSSGNTILAEGIAPGSTFSASLAPGENLSQEVSAEPDWFVECFFQSPDTFDRAFNILIHGPGGNINLRFQGTAEGADQTWNLFDNVTQNDAWGAAIALPPVQPGATYQLRIIGRAWDGIAPTYDLELSAPNSVGVAASVTGLGRFQTQIPTGPPNLVRFSTEFGASPGFVVDDVIFKNGTPLPSGAPEISSLVFDPSAQTSTLTFSTLLGVLYSLEASNDLENWGELDDFSGTGPDQVYIENGVTSPRRFYRLRIVE